MVHGSSTSTSFIIYCHCHHLLSQSHLGNKLLELVSSGNCLQPFRKWYIDFDGVVLACFCLPFIDSESPFCSICYVIALLRGVVTPPAPRYPTHLYPQFNLDFNIRFSLLRTQHEIQQSNFISLLGAHLTTGRVDCPCSGSTCRPGTPSSIHSRSHPPNAPLPPLPWLEVGFFDLFIPELKFTSKLGVTLAFDIPINSNIIGMIPVTQMVNFGYTEICKMMGLDPMTACIGFKWDNERANVPTHALSTKANWDICLETGIGLTRRARS